MQKLSGGKSRAASSAIRLALKSLLANRGVQGLAAGTGAGALAYGEQELVNKGIAGYIANKPVHHSTVGSRFIVPLGVGATVASHIAKGGRIPKGGGPMRTGLKGLTGMNPRTALALPTMPVLSGALSSISSMSYNPKKVVDPDSKGGLGGLLQKVQDTRKALDDPAAAVSIDKIPKYLLDESHDKLNDFLSSRWNKSLQSVVGATAGLGIAEILPYLTKYKTDERGMSPEKYDKYRKKRRKQESLYRKLRVLLPILGYAAPYSKEIWNSAKSFKELPSILAEMRQKKSSSVKTAVRVKLPSAVIKKLLLGTGGYMAGKAVQNDFSTLISGEGPTTNGTLWTPKIEGRLKRRDTGIPLKGADQIAPILSALSWMSLGGKHIMKPNMKAVKGLRGAPPTARVTGISPSFLRTTSSIALPGVAGGGLAALYNLGMKPRIDPVTGEQLKPLADIGDDVGAMMGLDPSQYIADNQGKVTAKALSELWKEYRPDLAQFTKHKLIPGAVGSTLAYLLASKMLPKSKKPLRKVRNAEKAYRRETAEQASRRMAIGLITAAGTIGAPAAYEAIMKIINKRRAAAS